MISLGFNDVMERLAPVDLVRPIRAAFIRPPVAPERTHHAIPRAGEADGSLQLIPAWREGDFIGVKVATVFPGNSDLGLATLMGQYLMLSAETGAPVAIIDGRALTLLRAAAVSALAADVLAPPEARRLLIVGAGQLAPYLAEAHAAVRDYASILIWARRRDQAEDMAARLRALSIPVDVAVDLERAARKADVISCATMACRPLIRGAWLAPRAHLDLVGGFRPDMREADDDALAGALVVADAQDAVTECGDLCGPIASGAIPGRSILLLEAVLRSTVRPGPGRRTVFKSIGSATADLAAAEHLLHRVLAGRSAHSAPRRLLQVAR